MATRQNDDEFEPEFSGNDGGDRFFGKPEDEEARPGSVLAAYEVPAEGAGDDEPEPVHFECVAYDWAQDVDCCLFHDLLSASRGPAGLAVLEFERPPGWVTPGGAPGSIAWYQVDYEPCSLRDSDGRIYTNLFSDGTPVRAKGRPADPEVVARLILEYFPDSLELAMGPAPNAFANVGPKSSGVAFYDVGQGAWQGVIDPNTKRPMLYVDVGGGVLYNRRTFPKDFRRPPPVPTIILSHWDWDHWSSARRYPSLMRAHWIAPPVPAKPIQVRVAMDIQRLGRLTILPLPKGQQFETGCLRIERCTGTTENDSGLAVTVLSRQKNGRTCLLPGDAAYRHVPSVAIAGSEPFNAICMSHHGGRLHSTHYPKPKPGAVAANSSGPGNTYKHPLFQTLRDHKNAGWPMPVQTGTSGSRPCHVFLPWGKKPQLFHGPATLSGPNMTV